ncbi:hypothetical protein [Paraburkholderia sp. J67]|uniref:hypothetical protein n=1 Tax=Paraburkholderia sp. J67 TaxID=2805435 RepID=UPI002ABD9D69|nr:hypothetical protein [Paraburkholderia sp. J67]
MLHGTKSVLACIVVYQRRVHAPVRCDARKRFVHRHFDDFSAHWHSVCIVIPEHGSMAIQLHRSTQRNSFETD